MIDEAVWDQITEQWRERDFTLLSREVKRVDAEAVTRLDALLGDDRFGEDEQDAAEPVDERAASEILEKGFSTAAAHPQGPLLLALYVYARCLLKWELAAEYSLITDVAHTLNSATRPLIENDALGEDDRELLRACVEQAQTIEDAMLVENALQCSCPVAMEQHAHNVELASSAIAESVPGEQAALSGARRLLRSDIEASRAYFRELTQVGHDVGEMLGHLEMREPIEGTLGSRIESLRKAITEEAAGGALEGDVYASELETHLASLEALAARSKRSWLRIDDAELVYIYPFTLDDETADSAPYLKKALAGAPSWRLGPRQIVPAEIRGTHLSDIWERADASEWPHQSVTIRLPEIYVKTTAHEPLWDDEEPYDLLECETEIRLNRLGNHYVRITFALEDATLHDLNQALRRSSPGMGDEVLTFEGGMLSTPVPEGDRPAAWGDPDWTKFVSADDDGYVQDLMRWVKEQLDAGVGGDADLPLVSDPVADFHVSVGIRKVSMQDGSDASRTAPASRHTPVKLQDEVGASLLFRPVGSFAASLEEWAAYSNPEPENLLEDAREGELIVRTADTTIAYLPTSPDWQRDEYEQMIEFVAATPPLFTAWEKRIRSYARDVETSLEEVRAPREGTNRRKADDTDAPDPLDLRKIHDNQAALHELEANIRRRVANLRSPRLVNNRETRVLLDRLWTAAGLPALEEGLDRQLAVISALQERQAAIVSKIAEDERRREERRQLEIEKRQRRLRQRIEGALAVIAVTSLAGLFDWINGGFALRDRGWVVLEVGLLLSAVLLLSYFLFLRKSDE